MKQSIFFSITLPDSRLKLVKLLQKSRRTNKYEIIQNYLRMMKLSFDECYRVLKKDKFYVMVVNGLSKSDKGKIASEVILIFPLNF